MDQKLAKYLISLKEEAEEARRGASGEVSDVIADIERLTSNLVNESDISFALATVFDEESGIFSAVDIMIPSRDRVVRKALENCLAFIAEFVSQIGKRALTYAPLIKARCLSVFKREDSKAVQAAALTPLISILELSMQESGPLDFSLDWTCAESLLVEYRRAKTSGTLRSNILVVIGYSVERFPHLFQEENLNDIIKQCLDTLEEQLHQVGKDPLYVLVAGAIKCVDSLLGWFDKSLPAGGTVENSRRIYAYVEQVIHFRDDLRRYEMVKVGLRLLSRHASLFRLRLLENSMVILEWLKLYCVHTNAQLRDAAILAFEQLISEIVNCIGSDDHRVKHPQQTYKKILLDALGVLDSRSDPRLKSLAILTVGKFSSLIVKFSGKQSLLQAFYRLVPFGGSSFRSSNGREESLKFSVTLAGAFADMVVYIDSLENYMVSLIIEAIGNIFYGYPYLFPKARHGVHNNLQRVFKALYAKGAVFSIFLTNIVWSSLERAMTPSDDGRSGAPLWKHYAELWSRLLNSWFDKGPNNSNGNIDKGQFLDQKLAEPLCGNINVVELQAFVFDCLLRCIMKALAELNIKYRVKSVCMQMSGNSTDPDVEAHLLDGEGEVDFIEPLDPLQMKKYLNLVEFVQEFLSRDIGDLFLKWVFPFGRCLVELSSRYPLISGFYKLLSITIQKADGRDYFSKLDLSSNIKATGNLKESGDRSQDNAVGKLISLQDQGLCKNFLCKYLQEVLVASRRYKLELLASCLRLCLSAPPSLISIESLVGPMTNALKIGLRHYPLAMVAMDSLEKWHNLHPEKLEPCLLQIVPHFNHYLVKSERMGSGDVHTTGGPITRLSNQLIGDISSSQLARTKEMRAKEAEIGPFEHIQIRIEKFLGRIGGQSHLLVSDIDLLQVFGVGGLAWDARDQVKFTLPFKDAKPDMWLDSLLLRIVEISTSSSDRRAKVAACELLHAILLVMLGNAAKGPMHRKGEQHHSVHYDKLYKRLFPAILRLAVDVELVTRQLFAEFAKQLIHWFTSNKQKENPDSMALLDSILDGLIDAENGSLREFCAECFAEFMQWSVRHASVEVDRFVNIASMLRRLYTRLDHPNPYHRLGAAMAAHRIYPVLRENGSIVDHHVLEILFFCVKSLRVGETDDEQIGTIKQLNKVMEGLERLVRRNVTALQKNKKDRKMFLNIQEFMKWLLLQTGRPEEKCRKKCMWLFSSICGVLPAGSSANWFKLEFKTAEEVQNILHHFSVKLKFPKVNGDKPLIQMLELWMREFICSLHWIGWAVTEGLVPLNELFIGTEKDALSIGSTTNVFLQEICFMNRHADLYALTPVQKESYGYLRLNTVLHLLNFLKVILYVELQTKEQDVNVSQELMHLHLETDSNVEKLVPFNEPYFQNFFCQLLLHPQEIAHAPLQSHVIEELMKLVRKIIKILSSASPLFKQCFMQSLKNFLHERKVELDLNSFDCSEQTDLVDMTYLLKGYQQLHLAGVLLPALGKENAKSTGQKLLNSLFSLERECPPALEPVALEMLTLAISLGVSASEILELVLDQKKLNESCTKKPTDSSAGSMFYFNFRKVIVHQIKFSYKECLALLLQEAVQNFTARLLLNALLDDYLIVESITKSSFLREFLQHIQLLSACCSLNATLSDKLFFLEILQKLFMLDTEYNIVLAEDQPSFGFITESFFSFLKSSHLVPDSGTSKLLQTSTIMTVKNSALVVVPYFFKSSLDQKIQCHLVNALTKVVTDHLLVQETDIPQGSNERVLYVQMLQRLEVAVLAANKLELLEIVFPLFGSHVQLAWKTAHEILKTFAEIVGENRGIACDMCLQMLNDGSKVPRLRRAVFDNMFVPMITAASVDFVADWFEKHIGGFSQIFDRQTNNIQSTLETEQDYLVVRICYYKLVELLFGRLDAAVIKDRITPIVTNQQLMQHATSDSRAKNDPGNYPFPENISLWRDLHITAYNCLAEIVMRTQDQEKLYAILFKDFPGKPLWQHLVDCSKVYNSFPVETSLLQTSYLDVKGLQAERTHTKGGGRRSFVLSSQYVVGATLSQEPVLIRTFLDSSQGIGRDDATAKVDDKSQFVAESFEGNNLNTFQHEGEEAFQEDGDELVEKVPLDQDDFDQHPSMGIILRLIEHCQQKFGVKYSSEEMPEWMRAFYTTLDSAVTPINVCLFIAKVITKARKIFAPFATAWFRPYILATLRDPDHSGGRTFHYMLRDICITVLEWNLSVPPDVSVASSLVNHLISVAVHTSKLVLQANLEIIRLFLQTWKDVINLDRHTIVAYLTIGGRSPNTNDKSICMKRYVGLQLLGAMEASNILFCMTSDGFTFSEDDLCRALLLNINFKLKNVYEAAAEFLGILFKQIEGEKFNIKEQMLHLPLKQALLTLFRQGDYGQFLNIVDKITMHFPSFLEGYASTVLALLAPTHGVFRVTALNILLRHPHSIPNLFNSISPFLSKLLTHRDEVAQFKSLQLVAELVKDLPHFTITEKVMPVLYESFSTHENTDCRQLYFKILIFLYREMGMEKNELLHHHLLLGLADDSDVVRHNVQSFWHSQMSRDLGPRFLQLVNDIYDPDIEESWAQVTNVLLLKLCEDSVDFERPIFSAPLSECEFHEYTIDTSWLGGTLPMTPLFSETLLSSQYSQDIAIQGSQGAAPDSQQLQMINATNIPSQSLTLSESQSTMSGETQGESSLLAPSQTVRRGSLRTIEHKGGALIDTGTKLKRRIFHSSIADSQAKTNALNALRRRQSRLAQQVLERANKVQMMRRYRIGELPDIEIAHKDVIIPLSVLAEKDNVFSRILLIVLCHAIYSLQSSTLQKSEHELKLSVRDGIERALQRTKNGISFVGCAMDLGLENKESWIQPKVVGSAAQKSRNFHTGILFLENAILHEMPPEQPHEASRKRHCGSKMQIGPGNAIREAWSELAKLYKSIGECDIVLLIYKKHLTIAPITEQALEAQLHGDSSKALQLYDEAINQFEGSKVDGIDITELEQDIWYNQRLHCLIDLNRWQDIMEDTLCQIGNETSKEYNFQKLWDPDMQDPYLGLFIKGSIKLTKYSSLLSDFLQNALKDPLKRNLLHEEFSTELAGWAIINDQFDLAKFYIQQGYYSFRKRWSSIHSLATVSKHLLVRQLQHIIELDEFIEFIQTKNINVELPRLLAAWRNRWPTAEFDDVEAWDDIVQNRLLYILKSQGLVRRHLGEGSEDVGRQLANDLDSQRAHMFYHASRGLMMQGAYDAAQGYMNQYMAAIEGSSRSEKLDFKFFKGLVKLRCLQADRESLVNAYEAKKMLQQVCDYVTSTAGKRKYQSHVQWRNGLKLLKGDVTSQLARVCLKVLPLDYGSTKEVENGVSLLGTAYTTYSSILEEYFNIVQLGEDTQFSSQKLAKAFVKFAFFCDELLASTVYPKWGSQVQSRIKEGDSSVGLPHPCVYPTLIVKHIMKALQLDNSMQAQHGIARVLTLLGQHNDTHAEFLSQLKGIPCWLFIAWIPQMLAVMDKDAGRVLIGLLEDIAQSYPQALYFPFNVSKSDFGDVGRDRTKKLETLLDNPILKGFTRALEDLTFPEQRLRNGLVHIKNQLSIGDNKGAQEAFHSLFEDCLDVKAMSDNNRKSGEYNIKFARNYSKRITKAIGENGSKLKSMDEKHFSEALRPVIENLVNCQKNLQVGKLSLSSLSKWMADFDESKDIIRRSFPLFVSPFSSSGSSKEESNEAAVEIPGSYSGFKKPDPSTHVKLMSFDETLLCLSSKQRPKILKMRGSDEKDYKFVVKGGEDLRLDQRIEQLFDVMNTILHRHSSCAKRKLSLRTYAVIPISKQCGLMQFVEDTRVIEDVIKDGLAHRMPTSGQTMSRQGRNTPEGLLYYLRSQYQEWIEKRGASKNSSESYTNMYRKVGADEVGQKMNSLISQLPWDALKTGISRLATSAESFLALRSQFVQSLSVLSICGYVAGVGDRHLSNFLMDTKNGMLVPIDFGFSFGTGVILLPVPELIPFRLTHQFTNLLLPLDSIGLLRNDMVLTLSALNTNREIISAVMDVFVNEPLVDWKNEAMRTAPMQQLELLEGDSSNQTHQLTTHEQQHVSLKIEHAHRKLNFWNPADITISELQSSIHFGKPYLHDLEQIVRGNPEHNIRARIQRSVCKNIQEQVDCLIDQATDPNLLGRIWVGWQPWI